MSDHGHDVRVEALDLGTPGASARREHARRRQNRENRMRAKHPRIGGLLLALGATPQHERSWARGALGEEVVARSLAKHLRPGTLVLHDRAIAGSRGNVDHIAVAPSGVWVIDSKRYEGKVDIHAPLLGKARLTVAGHGKTQLIRSLACQVELVAGEMARIARDVPVQGALCFVDADLPVVFKLSFGGFPILHPRPLAKRINRAGPVGVDRVRQIAIALTDSFPAA
jgi:hypothetical protein